MLSMKGSYSALLEGEQQSNHQFRGLKLSIDGRIMLGAHYRFLSIDSKSH